MCVCAKKKTIEIFKKFPYIFLLKRLQKKLNELNNNSEIIGVFNDKEAAIKVYSLYKYTYCMLVN